MFPFSGLAQTVTIDPLYEEPFDLGAGGSNLTWAKQESILIHNSALLPYGGKIFKWIGLKTNIIVGKDSLSIAQNKGQIEGSQAGSSSGGILDILDKHPIHLGTSTAASFLSNNGGVGIFASTTPDIRFWKRGDPFMGSGTPTLLVRNDAFAGAYASLATRSFWRWLSFGVTAKHLIISKAEERIDLIEAQKNPDQLSERFSNFKLQDPLQGTGADASVLLFFQSHYFDLKLATTAENVGDTPLTGGTEEIKLPMIYNGGLGITLHTGSDAIHVSADLRDVLDVAGEQYFKRLRAGVRMTLRTYLGIAAGVYHGNPSYSVEVDLILLRLTATMYTKEYGRAPGIDSRTVYMGSINAGFSF